VLSQGGPTEVVATWHLSAWNQRGFLFRVAKCEP